MDDNKSLPKRLGGERGDVDDLIFSASPQPVPSQR